MSLCGSVVEACSRVCQYAVTSLLVWSQLQCSTRLTTQTCRCATGSKPSTRKVGERSASQPGVNFPFNNTCKRLDSTLLCYNTAIMRERDAFFPHQQCVIYVTLSCKVMDYQNQFSYDPESSHFNLQPRHNVLCSIERFSGHMAPIYFNTMNTHLHDYYVVTHNDDIFVFLFFFYFVMFDWLASSWFT